MDAMDLLTVGSVAAIIVGLALIHVGLLIGVAGVVGLLWAVRNTAETVDG